MAAAVVIGFALWRRSNVAPASRPPAGSTDSPTSVPKPTVHADIAVSDGANPSSAIAEKTAPSGRQKARAYRLSLDGDRVSLEAVKSIEGRFRKRRARRAHPGMIRCRLLGADNAVLAEGLFNAPDYRCVVLDAAPGRSAAATPAALTADGPVVFQVRLPEVDGATVLEVLRIDSGSSENQDSLPERLLAHIPLPSR